MTATAAAPITGKTVVVVGGSRGIGLEWVARLLQQGNTVVATARNPAASPGLQQLAGEAAAGKLTTMALDAASADSIAAWAEALKGAIGHVDVLIYNAGVLHESVVDKLADVTAARLADTFATNTFGPLLLTQALVKQGLLGGDGAPSLCVFTTSSVGSVSALPHADQMPLYAYRASKAALNVLVRTLGAELAPLHVSCVLIHPGYVATDMTHGGAVAPGAISTADSVGGMLALLQDGRELAGKYFEYTGAEMAW